MLLLNNLVINRFVITGNSIQQWETKGYEEPSRLLSILSKQQEFVFIFISYRTSCFQGVPNILPLCARCKEFLDNVCGLTWQVKSTLSRGLTCQAESPLLSFFVYLSFLSKNHTGTTAWHVHPGKLCSQEEQHIDWTILIVVQWNGKCIRKLRLAWLKTNQHGPFICSFMIACINWWPA